MLSYIYTYKTDLFALARMYQETIIFEILLNNYNRYAHPMRKNYPTNQNFNFKEYMFSNFERYKELSKSLIPLQEPKEINKITCLNGKNREQSYKAMTDVLEEIVGLITP